MASSCRGAGRNPSPRGHARRRGCTTKYGRQVLLLATRYALPNGMATNLVALPDFTRISAVRLPAL